MLLPWREKLDSGLGTTHGNADLQLIDVLVVMLAAFFNPLARSQRCIEALSRQAHVQEQTGVSRVPRSTLSDALRRRDADLESITRQIIALDGSYFTLMGEAAWALASPARNDDGSLRHDQLGLNLQLDVERFAPIDCDLSGHDDSTEAKAFMRRLKSNVIYIADRNFIHFGFINAIFEKKSSLVLRLKKSNHFDVTESHAMDDADRAHGVMLDEIGHLPGAKSAGNEDHRSFTSKPPVKTLRRVTIWDEKNQTKLILLTDLLDVPARVSGVIYRMRWTSASSVEPQIELFFKWLKCWASFDHMISRDPRALTLHFYVAVIATLLTHITTGRKLSKYSLLYLGLVSQGLMSWQQMEEGMAVIEREKELERIRLARKRAERASKTSH